jgi:hypothetical protein
MTFIALHHLALIVVVEGVVREIAAGALELRGKFHIQYFGRKRLRLKRTKRHAL